MNLKTLSIVIGFLALASVAVFVVNRPAPDASTDPRVGAPLVSRETVAKTAKLKLSDQGKTVELAKQADGSWAVLSYHGLPADFSKLSSFVDELFKTKVDRFVSARAERLAGFEFKDTRIALLDSGDKELWSLTLGKNAEGGGRLIRFQDEKRAYLCRLNAWLDTESKNWADSSLLSLKPEDVAQVEITLAGSPAPIAAKRAKKEDAFAVEKVPEGQKLKADKITSLINSLSGLRFSETSALDDVNAVEAAKHERSVKLTTFDGKTLSVALGRKPEQKIIKIPEAPKDAKKEGPAAVLAKIESSLAKQGEEKGAEAAKPLEPITETIPAGPVFARISSSDEKAPVNALMKKRAFQVFEFAFTSIPEKTEDLFEALPKPEPVKEPQTQPAPEPAKS